MNLLKEMVNGTEASRKYKIYGTDGSSGMEQKTTKTPAEAIEWWFKLQRKYNLNVAIYAMSKNDAVVLLDWAGRNPDAIRNLAKRYPSDYNIPFMVRKLENGYFHLLLNKGTFNDDDGVAPFEIG